MDNNTVITIVIAAVVIAAGIAFLVVQRRRSHQMRARYGAEYIAAVDEAGRHKGEAELRRREKRVEAFDIRPLHPEEAVRFRSEWRRIQADFVDDPGMAVADADVMLGKVMHARGYPVSYFEQRADDLSVNHPKLVSDYRMAHQVALAHARGEAGTEDLRRAMIHYRDLFDDLVTDTPDDQRPAERRTFSEEERDELRAARQRDDETDVRRPRRGPGDDRAPRA